MKNKQQSDVIYLYGKHTVLSAISNKKRRSIILYTTKNNFSELNQNIKDLISKKNISVKIVDRSFLDKLLGEEKNHQGICLLAKKLEELDLEFFMKHNSTKEKITLACLDQVSDPQNIGAILRNAAAFGIDGLILTKNHSPEENDVIARVASGALDLVPIIRVTNLAQTISFLKKHDFTSYGMSLEHKNLQEINKTKFHAKSLIILGAEGSGLRKLTNEKIDQAVYIPIKNLDSLNVSSTSAIVFFYANN
jgi:23S rRNA (guanosine2251-2'-O)-methyltransferase